MWSTKSYIWPASNASLAIPRNKGYWHLSRGWKAAIEVVDESQSEMCRRLLKTATRLVETVNQPCDFLALNPKWPRHHVTSHLLSNPLSRQVRSGRVCHVNHDNRSYRSRSAKVTHMPKRCSGTRELNSSPSSSSLPSMSALVNTKEPTNNEWSTWSKGGEYEKLPWQLLAYNAVNQDFHELLALCKLLFARLYVFSLRFSGWVPRLVHA